MWRKITIGKQQIVATSDRAYLIVCPKGQYSGFRFWHPAKLVRVYPTKVELSYTDEFLFRLFKKGQGRYNSNDVVASETISYLEVEEIFEKINSNFNPHGDESYLKVKEPKKIKVKAEVLDEFKNKKPR